MVTKFILPYRQYRRLHDRAYRAQQRGHQEVCGLLGSPLSAPSHLSLHFLANGNAEPGKFTLSISVVRGARIAMAEGGIRHLGLFHSHPLWWSTLGRRDRRRTPTNWYHMVYDVCSREPRLWRVVKRNGRCNVVEVPLSVDRLSRSEAR
jgi:hypothetical protein